MRPGEAWSSEFVRVATHAPPVAQTDPDAELVYMVSRIDLRRDVQQYDPFLEASCCLSSTRAFLASMTVLSPQQIEQVEASSTGAFTHPVREHSLATYRQ